jgi:hypothetical protein
MINIYTTMRAVAVQLFDLTPICAPSLLSSQRTYAATTPLDQMDVDLPTSLPSGSKCVSTSHTVSFPKKRARIILSQAELTALHNKMNEHSRTGVWKYILNHTEDDHLGLRRKTLFSHVLCSITSELRDNTLAIDSPKTSQGATDILESFNKDELEEWEIGVRNGVENRDWTGLIAHRTHIYDYRIVRLHLIANTAKLMITKMKNMAPGVPIELRKLLHFQSVVSLTQCPTILPA